MFSGKKSLGFKDFETKFKCIKNMKKNFKTKERYPIYTQFYITHCFLLIESRDARTEKPG